MIGRGLHNVPEDKLRFVRYDPSTGAVRGHGTVDTPEHLQTMRQVSGRSYLLGRGRPETHYVDLSGARPILRERVGSGAALDGTVLRGLPVPCTIVVREASGEYAYDCDETEANLDIVHPGTYAIIVKARGHIDATFKVSVP